MVGHNVTHLSPLIKCCLSNQGLAVKAKILDLGLVGVTDVANIFKMDVHYEVLRNYPVFVFADIFGTQLHLSSLNVVASLDESGVEHDSEEDLIGEASVLKNDLHVILHQE